jgi:hypothetical protein
MRKQALASIITLIGWSAPASAEVLYLTCNGSQSPWYVTIDFGREIAQVSSSDPVNERPWYPAEITDAQITWHEHCAKSNPTAILNRYSGNFQYGDQRGVLYFKCDRTQTPKIKY